MCFWCFYISLWSSRSICGDPAFGTLWRFTPASIVFYLGSLLINLFASVACLYWACMLLLFAIVRLVDCVYVLYVCTLLRSYDWKQLMYDSVCSFVCSMNVVAVFMFSAFVVVAVAQLVKLTVAIKNSWRIGSYRSDWYGLNWQWWRIIVVIVVISCCAFRKIQFFYPFLFCRRAWFCTLLR